jgi:hypothetical protein
MSNIDTPAWAIHVALRVAQRVRRDVGAEPGAIDGVLERGADLAAVVEQERIVGLVDLAQGPLEDRPELVADRHARPVLLRLRAARRVEVDHPARHADLAALEP